MPKLCEIRQVSLQTVIRQLQTPGQRRYWKSEDISRTGIHEDLTTTMLQQFPLAKPIIYLITESSLTPNVKKLQLTWLLIITAEMQHKEEMFISADEVGMDWEWSMGSISRNPKTLHLGSQEQISVKSLLTLQSHHQVLCSPQSRQEKGASLGISSSYALQRDAPVLPMGFPVSTHSICHLMLWQRTSICLGTFFSL